MEDNDFIDIDILPATSEEAAYKRTNDRIDDLISSMEHGGGGQAEVIDIRTGYDETQYDTAGKAVRTQITEVRDKIENCKSEIEENINTVKTDVEDMKEFKQDVTNLIDLTLSKNTLVLNLGMEAPIKLIFNEDKTVKWDYTQLVNLSYLSETNINLGSSITISGKASGGTSPYTYSYYYKKSTDTDWVTKLANTTTTSVSLKPGTATTYNIKVTVSDSAENTAEKILLLTVTPTEGIEESGEEFADEDMNIIESED